MEELKNKECIPKLLYDQGGQGIRKFTNCYILNKRNEYEWDVWDSIAREVVTINPRYILSQEPRGGLNNENRD